MMKSAVMHSVYDLETCSGCFLQSVFHHESLVATAGLDGMVNVSSILRQSSITSKEGRLWWSKDLCTE